MADSQVDLRNKIRAALAAISGADFADEAQALLGVLGYRSERTLSDQSGRPGDLLRENADTISKQEFLRDATSIRVLFQMTDEEIAEQAGSQRTMFRDNTFSGGNVRSFLFTVVELDGESYPRGKYTQFTREVNKCFPAIPAVVLFRTATGLLTLAFVHVRPNKRNPDRDVLGRVSLIREINHAKPHRAHLDILAELSLEDRLHWMGRHGNQRNFDGLLAAWLDALDTEELNRRFYRELFRWFERAVSEARFPTGGAKSLRTEEHVIRLITRMLFIWFIKEKGLAAEDLFVEAQVGPLLKNYDRTGGDSYYRTVLQNLFFATLNTEIPQRRFSRGDNRDHRNFSVYRYRKEMTDPETLVALFAQTPFINGGLFDCLDTEKATGDGGYRIDYFTDKPTQRRGYSIPNRIFFDGDGLITLLNHYKFTVEENTPAETEVALDPELLGKVFENLLAAYNPETKETARKQTGSYYTPRAVVDYMVDEALVAAMAQKVQPGDGDSGYWKERLHFLLDYDDAEDAGEFFDGTETGELVRAISELRVLDPAAGSGAFPMGVLHKLTLALRRLDQDNQIWEGLQKKLARERAASAFDTRDQRERDEELREISATFERYRESDYGRKLYLIQNSIYGVDIQPVACQIAKLRFFISLAIEQQPTGDPNANYGIQPLPNLETRFVAANTLLGLSGPQGFLISLKAEELQRALKVNRERHFHATSRRQKLGCIGEDERLRGLLAAELRQLGMPPGDAGKIANWKPYDQNAHAEWFDTEYMFGVIDGFDVVIGNPPYGITTRDQRSALIGNTDSYTNFIARAVEISPVGMLAYITPTSWETGERFKKFRKYLFNSMALQKVVNLPYDVFGSSYVDSSIMVGAMGSPAPKTFRLATFERRANLDLEQIGDNMTTVNWHVVARDTALRVPLVDWAVNLFGRLATGSSPLGSMTSSKRGIEAYQFNILDNPTYKSLPFFLGKVYRYEIQPPSLSRFVAVSDKETPYHQGPRIWTRRIVSRANRLMSAFTNDVIVVKKDIYIIKPAFDNPHKLAALLAILNSSLLSFLYLSRSVAAIKDDFRQVTLSGLRELPIVFPDDAIVCQLELLVKAREQRAGDTAELERLIDEIVYVTYGVTDKEQEAIGAWLSQSG